LPDATPSPDIFISYNRVDGVLAASLRRELAARGFETFLDSDSLPLGRSWPEQLERQLSRCRTTVVLIGQSGLGPWQRREADLALDLQSHAPERSVIPVLLTGADPSVVPGFLKLNTWIDLRDSAAGSPRQWNALVDALRRPNTQIVATASDVCPYVGIHAFAEDQEAFFFGRQAYVQAIVKVVRTHPVTCVVGPSGIGKSSIVHAGVIPELRRIRSPEPVWDVCRFTPGGYPFRRLADALAAMLNDPPDPDKLANDLRHGDGGLDSIVQRILGASNGVDRLLILADQFEELFTPASEADRGAFINLIVSARRSDAIRFVITLRADFYGEALRASAELTDVMANAQVPIGPMRREELRAAIEEPARRVGLQFEPNLVDRILQAVVERPGSLPLLEYALTALWNERSNGMLTGVGYTKIKGVEEALAKRAEDVCAASGQPDVYYLFMRLVRAGRPGEEGGDVRRRASKTEFPERVWKLALQFARPETRLLVFSRDSSGNETVEIAHEALIRHWERWTNWIDKDREFLLFRQRLEPFLDTRALLPQSMWDEAHRWTGDPRAALFSEVERALIESSLQQRPGAVRRPVVAVLAALLAVAAVGVSWKLYDDSTREHARSVLKNATAFPLGAPRAEPGNWTPQDDALWQLAQLPLRTKRWVAREVLDNAFAGIFQDGKPLQIMAPLDLDHRREILEPVLRDRCPATPPLPDPQLLACASMLALLDSAPGWAGEFLARQIEARSPDEFAVEQVATAVGSMRGIAPSDAARVARVFARRLTAPEKQKDALATVNWGATAEKLAPLAHVMSDGERSAVAEALFRAFDASTTLEEAAAAATAAETFVGQQARDRAAPHLLRLLERNGVENAQPTTLVQICRTASSADVHAQLVAHLMRGLSGARPLTSAAALGFADCVATLSASERDSIARTVLDKTPPDRSLELLIALQSVAKPIADAAVHDLIDVMKREYNPYSLQPLVQHLTQTLGTNLSPQDTAAAAEVLVEHLRTVLAAMERQVRGSLMSSPPVLPSEIDQLCDAIAALGPNGKIAAASAASLILKQVERLPALMASLAPSFAKLASSAASADVNRYGELLSTSVNSVDARELNSLAATFVELANAGADITDSVVNALLRRLRDAQGVQARSYAGTPSWYIVEALMQMRRDDRANREVIDRLLKIQTDLGQKNIELAIVLHLSVFAPAGDARVARLFNSYIDQVLAQGPPNDAALAQVVSKMDPASRSETLTRVVNLLSTLPSTECYAVGWLAEREQISVVLDVLKWPSCSDGSRDALQRRVISLMGYEITAVLAQPNTPTLPLVAIPSLSVPPFVVPPLPTDPSSEPIDEAKFLRAVKEWARRNNYDLKRAPAPPATVAAANNSS
jgi:hypothetical protein